MADWQSGFLETNGIRVHFTRTGGAHPPLVLAHGFSDDGLCWTAVARALQDHFDIVMPDARGHGRSDAPDEGYGPIEMADDLAGVITGLGLAAPIVLGHSMGATTSLFLASRHPALPRAIGLEDPPPSWAPDAGQPRNAANLARQRAWLEDLQTKSRETLMAEEHARNPLWSTDELGPWADSKLRMNLRFFNQLAPLEFDWAALLSRVTCPALLITADPALGAIVNDQQADSLGERLPQLRRAHIAGAGHCIHRDQLGPYLRVIQTQFVEWLARAG